jgi:hypothetical protein
LLTLPDEIVAEQRLKNDDPAWFDRRADYYRRMCEERTGQLRRDKPGDGLWPFVIFFELLRRAFFVPLVAETGAGAEFSAMEAFAEERLKACAGAELAEALLEMKPSLLNVAFDEPLAAAEAAYDRVFDRVMTVEQPTP